MQFLSVRIPDRLRGVGVKHWVRLQSLCFEALYPLVMQRGRLGSYEPLETRETAIENEMRRHARQCGCPCCHLLVGLLEQADELDHTQHELVTLAVTDNDEASAAMRTVSGVVNGILVHEAPGGRVAA